MTGPVRLFSRMHRPRRYIAYLRGLPLMQDSPLKVLGRAAKMRCGHLAGDFLCMWPTPTGIAFSVPGDDEKGCFCDRNADLKNSLIRTWIYFIKRKGILLPNPHRTSIEIVPASSPTSSADINSFPCRPISTTSSPTCGSETSVMSMTN